MNSYFLNNFYSRLIILSTIFCIILSLVIPELILNILAFSGILTFGIIHGANDLFLIDKVSTKKNLKVQFTYYLLMVLGFFIFFYSFPALALLTFVFLSSYHFGEHQLTLFNKKEVNSIKFLYFSYGLTIFSLIFYFNLNQVNEIIFDITSIKLNYNFYYIILVVSSFLTISQSLFFYKSLKDQLLIQVLLIILFVITLNFSNLIWSFGVYFVIWHSLPSIIEQTNFLYGKTKRDNIIKYFKKASFYWILSLFGLVFTYYFFYENQSQLLSIFFSFLAAITFPHTFVIAKIKKPSN